MRNLIRCISVVTLIAHGAIAEDIRPTFAGIQWDDSFEEATRKACNLSPETVYIGYGGKGLDDPINCRGNLSKEIHNKLVIGVNKTFDEIQMKEYARYGDYLVYSPRKKRLFPAYIMVKDAITIGTIPFTAYIYAHSQPECSAKAYLTGVDSIKIPINVASTYNERYNGTTLIDHFSIESVKLVADVKQGQPALKRKKEIADGLWELMSDYPLMEREGDVVGQKIYVPDHGYLLAPNHAPFSFGFDDADIHYENKPTNAMDEYGLHLRCISDYGEALWIDQFIASIPKPKPKPAPEQKTAANSNPIPEPKPMTMPGRETGTQPIKAPTSVPAKKVVRIEPKSPASAREAAKNRVNETCDYYNSEHYLEVALEKRMKALSAKGGVASRKYNNKLRLDVGWDLQVDVYWMHDHFTNRPCGIDNKVLIGQIDIVILFYAALNDLLHFPSLDKDPKIQQIFQATISRHPEKYIKAQSHINEWSKNTL